MRKSRLIIPFLVGLSLLSSCSAGMSSDQLAGTGDDSLVSRLESALSSQEEEIKALQLEKAYSSESLRVLESESAEQASALSKALKELAAMSEEYDEIAGHQPTGETVQQTSVGTSGESTADITAPEESATDSANDQYLAISSDIYKDMLNKPENFYMQNAVIEGEIQAAAYGEEVVQYILALDGESEYLFMLEMELDLVKDHELEIDDSVRIYGSVYGVVKAKIAGEADINVPAVYIMDYEIYD